jgi:hypothetical protein
MGIHSYEEMMELNRQLGFAGKKSNAGSVSGNVMGREINLMSEKREAQIKKHMEEINKRRKQMD